MKNIFIYLIALFACFSCEQDYLETMPHEVTDADLFKSPSRIEQVVNGCYDMLARYDSQQIADWALGDIVGHISWKGGEGPADMPDIENLKNFKYDATNALLASVWRDYYQGIYRCNVLLENIDQASTGDELKKQYKGEALFLRAYYYFKLNTYFGGVPLIDHVLSPSEYEQARSSMEEVYAFIESDLNQIIDNSLLPEKSQYAEKDLGRASMGAAKALLVKTYIFQKKWTLAEPLAKSITSSPEYGLENSIADIFSNQGENGLESIFEIQYKKDLSGEWGDDQEGTVSVVFQGDRNNPYFEGWGFNYPNVDRFVKYYSDQDQRKAETVLFVGDVVYPGTDKEFTITENHIANIDGTFNKKYLIPYEDLDASMSGAGNNWRAIRLADVYLWQAEAAYHNSSDWKTPLNRIRQRAGIGDYSGSDADGLNEIYLQRLLELGMEGHYFFDLVRTDRAASVLGEFGFIKEKHSYFPIPQSDIDLSNGKLN